MAPQISSSDARCHNALMRIISSGYRLTSYSNARSQACSFSLPYFRISIRGSSVCRSIRYAISIKTKIELLTTTNATATTPPLPPRRHCRRRRYRRRHRQNGEDRWYKYLNVQLNDAQMLTHANAQTYARTNAHTRTHTNAKCRMLRMHRWPPISIRGCVRPSISNAFVKSDTNA